MKELLSRQTGLQAMLGILTLLALLASPVSGAPITFAFEAEIDHMPTGIPFDSGLNIAIGDTIRGTLTFEPDPGDGTDTLAASQPDASAAIVIDGQTFGTTGRGNGILFRAANNIHVSDAIIPIQDQLELGAAFNQIPVGLGIGITSAGWSLRMAASSEVALGNPPPDIGRPLLPFETAMIPSDVDIWNYFSNPPQDDLGANLFISFSDGASGTVGFNARVNRFAVVPEPATSCLAFSACLVFFLLRFNISPKTIRYSPFN